jgi:uncharacterized protein YyaL (SSP411 family)
MLCALDYYLGTRREIVVVGKEGGEDTRQALERIWSIFAHRTAVAFLDPDWPHRREVEDRVPLLKGKSGKEQATLFFICENYACKAPTESLEEVENVLRQST